MGTWSRLKYGEGPITKLLESRPTKDEQIQLTICRDSSYNSPRSIYLFCLLSVLSIDLQLDHASDSARGRRF
jgi:hypothetical protein